MAQETSFTDLGFDDHVSEHLNSLQADCNYQDTHHVGHSNIGQLLLALSLSVEDSEYPEKKDDQSDEEYSNKKKFIDALNNFKKTTLKSFISDAVNTLWDDKDSEEQSELSHRMTYGKVKITPNDRNAKAFSTSVKDAIEYNIGLLMNELKNRLYHTSIINKGPQDEDLKPYFDVHQNRCKKVM